MESHHSKQSSAAPSQNFPSTPRKVAPDVTLADRSVGLCDSHGRVVGKSATGSRLQIAE